MQATTITKPTPEASDRELFFRLQGSCNMHAVRYDFAYLAEDWLRASPGFHVVARVNTKVA